MLSIVSVLFERIIFLLSYISGNNSFKKPLSPEEEQKYLELYKNGDKNAKDKLVEHNLRLVAHIAKKYMGAVKDNEDLISIGTIGLMKAISTYSPCKKTRLATYAARCIDNEILMVIRSNKKTQGDVYLNSSIGIDKEGNEISLIDVLCCDDNDIVDEIDMKIQTRNLYEHIKTELTEREFAVVKHRYGLYNGNIMTQQEIAEMLDISRSYVSRIEKRAITKLRKLLGR